jgi:hypothetical protein
LFKRRRIILTNCLILLIGVFVASEASSAPQDREKTVKKPTITVPCEKYKTLKEALEKASSGDIIYLKKGVHQYYSSIPLKENIEIFGDAPEKTKIIINMGGIALRSGVIFRDLTLELTHSNITIDKCEGVEIAGCIIIGKGGIGIVVQESFGVKVVNSTLVDLIDAVYIQYSPADITIRNSIIADNRVSGITVSPGTERKIADLETGEITIIPAGRIENISLNLSHNNVWGNPHNYKGWLPGESDISLDPKFISKGDYHLRANSPCIDAGDPDPEYSDPDGTRSDLGALPFKVF